jgi:LuxR family maltose regulon positive regulatory protein
MAAPRLVEQLVQRPRLLARLDARTPVSVLRAPLGFGKTTLVAQWVATQDPATEAVAWVRIRPDCGDAASVWAAVVDALTDCGWPLPVLSQHRSPQSLAQRMLGAADGPLLLVVDGFENVTATGIDSALVDLVWHTPGLRLVTCLRSHRHFADRLLTDVSTTVITAHELLFTADETAELLATIGLNWPRSCSGAVHAAIGGWPEPTRSFGLTVRDTRPEPAQLNGVGAEIAADYLHRYLLPAVTRPDRVEFALRTSLPEEFTVEIAELLSDDTATKSHLEWLEGEGVLVAEAGSAASSGDPIYRWPQAARHALAAAARSRLPDLLPELHFRLARWYLDDGRPERALPHAVQAGHWPLVIEVIEKGWRQLVFAHNDTLWEAFTATPLDVILTSPRALALRDVRLRVPDDLLLSFASLPASPAALADLGASERAADVLDTGLLMGVALRRRGLFDQALTYGDRLREIVVAARATHPDQVTADFPSVELNVGLSHLLAGDPAGALQPLRVAHEFAPDNPRAYIESDAASKLALAHAVLGEPDAADLWLEQHRTAPLAHTWLAPMIEVTAAVARLLTALDRLDRPRAVEARRALPEPTRIEEFWAYVLYAQSQYALHAGTPADMLHQLDRTRAGYRRWLGHGAGAGPLLAAAEADLLMSLGQGNHAHAVLYGVHRHHPRLRIGQARLATLTGDPAGALRLTTDTEWQRAASSRERLDMLLIQSIAAHRTGDAPTAIGALQRATDTVLATGVLRAFTTVPRAELIGLTRAVPAAAELLARPAVAAARDLYPPTVTLIRLTEREQRVLETLAQGLTVQQAAERLVVSYNTVKSQTQSLYRKLGADTRPDALARARQWGLLRQIVPAEPGTARATVIAHDGTGYQDAIG